MENDSPDIIVRTRYAPRVGEDAGKVGEFLVFGERTHRVGHIDGIVAELGSGQVPYDVRNVLAELQFVVGVGEFRTFQCRGDVVGLTLFGDGDRTALDEYAIGDDSRVVDYLCGIGTSATSLLVGIICPAAVGLPSTTSKVPVGIGTLSAG